MPPTSQAATAAAASLRLPPLPTLGDLLRLYDLRARRQLSQNFLLEPRLLNKMAKAAKPLTGCHVLEVGCGPGGLTRELFREGAVRVVGLELDRRFQPCLENLQDSVRCSGRELEVRFTSAVNYSAADLFPSDLRTDWHAKELPLVRVAGNLPFHVSTPLLMTWLQEISERRGVWSHGRIPLTLTFQKEFADRLLADTWTRDRGRPSIMAQYLCHVRRCFDISGRAFLPPAGVDVTVVRLVPLAEPLIPVPYPYVSKFVKHAFAFPNKSLVTCMETLFPPERSDLLIRLFLETGTQPQCTPRELSLQQFSALCCLYHRMCLGEQPDLFEFTFTGHEDLWRSRKAVQKRLLNGQTVSHQTVARLMNRAQLETRNHAAGLSE